MGIGLPDPARNPFLQARLPTLSGILGGIPTLDNPNLRGPRTVSFPLDATLGVSGTPRSGTGQTALLTGRNAARLFGRHFGPWTPVRLRGMLQEESVLRRAVDRGARVAFANAYPRGWPDGRRRLAAPPLAARAAGVLTRHVEHLVRGEAVASEIVNRGWKVHLGADAVPELSPADAGANLARIASRNDLTLYAHYATDHAGHRGGMGGGVESLERVDAFLQGVIDHLEPEALLIVASDHGNVEDVTAQHTRNPVLGIAHGPDAADFASGLGSITDVPRRILSDAAGE